MHKKHVASLALFCLLASPGLAEGPYRNRDNRRAVDPGEGTYPIPYHRPTAAEITEVLNRITAYLDRAMPARVVSQKTGKEILDFTTPDPDAVVDGGEADAFDVLDYTTGVIHSGMLLATEVTGDKRYSEFTARHLQFLADRLPYFRAQAEATGNPRRNSFRPILATESLDDSGAMCAALIRARRAGVGPDLKPVIDGWIEHISKKQFRLKDGTLARQRPQAQSVWADDFYMSIPALAQMGALSGDRSYTDDAARQVVQFGSHLFERPLGLYMHGRNLEQPLNPEYYWGRANGWAVLATADLLDVLPEDHPSRPVILKTYGEHLKALVKLQSGSGLWHQMLDKPDSYLETSATAMFVYGIAHAINKGWISPISFGSAAQAGWQALSTRVNERGQVEGTCVATTFASDHVYYYNRPVSPYATHGYGPVILAAAEMLRLLQNPAFDIRHQTRTYHYVPRPTPKP